MTRLDELKSRWFINVSDTATFPPQTRHLGSSVRASTDGNTVVGLRDGERFMRQWAEAVTAMRSGPAPKQCQVWLTGWRLEGVETLGHDHPESDALDTLHAAQEAGVTVQGMISRHTLRAPCRRPRPLHLSTSSDPEVWGEWADSAHHTLELRASQLRKD